MLYSTVSSDLSEVPIYLFYPGAVGPGQLKDGQPRLTASISLQRSSDTAHMDMIYVCNNSHYIKELFHEIFTPFSSPMSSPDDQSVILT